MDKCAQAANLSLMMNELIMCNDWIMYMAVSKNIEQIILRICIRNTVSHYQIYQSIARVSFDV